MLESQLGTDIVAQCLNDPENASSIAKSSKKATLRKYFTNLLSTSFSNHPSTKLVVYVAESSSWRRLWDLSLDKGGKGTRSIQFLFKELSQPCTGERLCSVCDHVVNAVTNCFEHTCEHHPNFVCELSSEYIVTTLKEDSSDSIFSIINRISDCNHLWF